MSREKSADMENYVRKNGRLYDQLRNIKITFDPFSYAPSSVLIELGDTKVFCAVSIQNGVPLFLRGKGSGWLTAEYNVLPYAAEQRLVKDVQQKNGRAIEISRIIGRTFRSVVDLTKIFGEKTIYIDCDVLQADGGTRVAAIIGASLALFTVQQKWIKQRVIRSEFLTHFVLAVSIGILQENIIVDPDFAEDILLDADFNLIATSRGDWIEIQGGAEKKPISQSLFQIIQRSAIGVFEKIMDIINQALVKKNYNLSMFENIKKKNKTQDQTVAYKPFMKIAEQLLSEEVNSSHE